MTELDPIGKIHQATIKREWDRLCPRAFHAADDGRNPQNSATISRWNGENCWFSGASGVGKSWMAWQILRRVALFGLGKPQGGRERCVACINSPLLHRYARSHGEDREDIEIPIKCARAVLVDDLDKMMDGKDLKELWDLICLAADNGATLITTSNITAKEIQSWLMLNDKAEPLPGQSPQLAAICKTAVPMLRRLREDNRHGKTIKIEPKREGK